MLWWALVRFDKRGEVARASHVDERTVDRFTASKCAVVDRIEAEFPASPARRWQREPVRRSVWPGSRRAAGARGRGSHPSRRGCARTPGPGRSGRSVAAPPGTAP
jgi:hypothetical protein